MSSNKKSASGNTKPSTKSSKAEKASFDKVITALEKENEAYVTPTAQSKRVCCYLVAKAHYKQTTTMHVCLQCSI